MSLKPAIVTLTLIFFSIGVSGQYKYMQKLGDLATVALPDTTKLIEKEGNKIYLTSYHGVIFLAEAGELSTGLKDVFKHPTADSIYDDYINGILGVTKGHLFYKNKIKINKQDGIEFGYKAIVKGQITFNYHQAIILNDTLLMCGIRCSDSLSNGDKNLSAFFSGFKIKSKEQLSTDRAKALGQKTGKIIAILILISIFILLGLAFMFIIRRIAYRRNNI